jgi:photosystem II stability/assembly factor-like uncharacterized protein
MFASWETIRPTGQDLEWYRCRAAAENDQYVLASSFGTTFGIKGSLYLSHSSGDAWTKLEPAGSSVIQWNAIAVSASGQYMLAAVKDRLYTSANYGVAWSLRTQLTPVPPDFLQFECGAMSQSGQMQFVVAAPRDYGSGELYRSSSYGVTWSKVADVVLTDPVDIAVSSDGSKVVVAGRSSLRVSTDFGNNWTTTLNLSSIYPHWPQKESLRVAMSGDGTVIAVCGRATYFDQIWGDWVQTYTLHTSTDGGAVWPYLNLEYGDLMRGVNSLANAAAISADGVKRLLNPAGEFVDLSLDSGVAYARSNPAGPGTYDGYRDVAIGDDNMWAVGRKALYRGTLVPTLATGGARLNRGPLISGGILRGGSLNGGN